MGLISKLVFESEFTGQFDHQYCQSIEMIFDGIFAEEIQNISQQI